MPDQDRANWRSSLEITARNLSGRADVRVLFAGNQARSARNLIVLPVPPARVTAAHRQAIHGLFAHELAHVMFTRFLRIPDPVEGQVVNVLEDARVERLFVERWPGSAFDLRAALDFFTADLTPVTPGWTPFRRFCLALYLDQRDNVEHPLLTRCRECRVTGALVEQARDLLRSRPVTACSTTWDVQHVGRTLLRSLPVGKLVRGSDRRRSGSGDRIAPRRPPTILDLWTPRG